MNNVKNAMNNLDFNNTEIAYACYSTQQLQERLWLFRVLKQRPIVNLGAKFIETGLRWRLPFVLDVVRYTVFRHFVGGESLEECLSVVEKLAHCKVHSILDYSVEGDSLDSAGYDATCLEFLRSVETTATSPHVVFSVFKPSALVPTQLLEKIQLKKKLSQKESRQWEQAQKRMERIFACAQEKNIPVLVDAEDSWTQDPIDEFVENMMEKYNQKQAIVWNTLQMYRHDRLAYLDHLLQKAQKRGFIAGIKLVRGAYLEKERERARQLGYPDPLYPTKEDTDRAYNEAIERVLSCLDISRVFLGTHNEASCLWACQLMKRHGIAAHDRRVAFSQLYGMGDHISFNLAHHSYYVAKYIPYGPVKAVLPYLFRRAEENSSIQGHADREVELCLRELKRRARLEALVNKRGSAEQACH